MLTFSEGASTVAINIRLPLRISCVHRIEACARNNVSLHGMIIWIESGTIMGLVERREEYHESRSKSPMMTLGNVSKY